MDVQDYEYFEERAKDVILQDITSSQHNANILRRLRHNDPEFTSLSINDDYDDDDDWDFIVDEGDHMGWLGYFVGGSTLLEELFIYNFPGSSLKVDAFLRRLGHNRSIQQLHILGRVSRVWAHS